MELSLINSLRAASARKPRVTPGCRRSSRGEQCQDDLGPRLRALVEGQAKVGRNRFLVVRAQLVPISILLPYTIYYILLTIYYILFTMDHRLRAIDYKIADCGLYATLRKIYSEL